MNKTLCSLLFGLATLFSICSYGQDSGVDPGIDFEIKRTLSGISYKSLDILREIEVAVQNKAIELCGAQERQDLTLEIKIYGYESCSSVNPKGALSGDFQNHRAPALVIGRCYPTLEIKGNILCKKP